MNVHSIDEPAKVKGVNNDWAFGPGSIIWKVMRDPVVFMLGQSRTATILMMHPPFAASVEHDIFKIDPLLRFRRVGMYAYGSLYGTKNDAEKLSNMVRTRHSQIVGVEELTQRPYQSHSEYELALTHVIEKSSYLEIYEAINGKLSDAERDQYFAEFRAASAMIGIQPEHVPSSYEDIQIFLRSAEKRFAIGKTGREVLCVQDNRDYEPGTALGDLPYLKRKLVVFANRVMFDMSFDTLTDIQRLILSINRPPKLRSRRLTRWLMKIFSRFMASERGQKIWEAYLQKKTYAKYTKAVELMDSTDYKTRAASFRVPDPSGCYYELPDLKRNWPGSVEHYALGREAEGELAFALDVVAQAQDVATQDIVAQDMTAPAIASSEHQPASRAV